jgi:hypothetical protein
MHTPDLSKCLSKLFSELVDGARHPRGGFILNKGDVGLLESLDMLSADDASRRANEGATVAAHAQHVRYGLSLMNRWAAEGGNPFADAKWEEAWKITTVGTDEWVEIRTGLRDETQRWLAVLNTPRVVSTLEETGMISSIAHLAYHFGAIRQISRQARGPTEGSYPAAAAADGE